LQLVLFSQTVKAFGLLYSLPHKYKA